MQGVVIARNCDNWEISGFSHGQRRLDVTVDGHTGHVLEAWGGYKAEWVTARGSSDLLVGPGAAWILLALCIVFIAPFVDPRRLLRAVHLDLLALIAVTASLVPFRYGAIWLSTPLAFAGLGVLVVRMLLRARQPRSRTDVLVPYARPAALLALGILLLIGRDIYTVAWGTASDVGYFSVYGAQSLLDGYSIYNHGTINASAYGPALHLAYIPFAALFPLAGGIQRGNDAAAHAATVGFDVLTAIALWVLGRRLRAGPAGARLGAALVFLWAANPIVFVGAAQATNDGLIAFLLVLGLIVIDSPPARGAVAMFAAAAKWVPVVVLPLFAAGTRPPSRRGLLQFALAAAITLAIVVWLFMPDGGPLDIYRVSVGDLANRQAPFSVWGLWDLPNALRQLCLAGVLAACVVAAWLPRERTVVTVAALATALLAAAQMTLPSWTYAYGVWFMGVGAAAIAAGHERISR